MRQKTPGLASPRRSYGAAMTTSFAAKLRGVKFHDTIFARLHSRWRKGVERANVFDHAVKDSKISESPLHPQSAQTGKRAPDWMLQKRRWFSSRSIREDAALCAV